MVWPDQRGRYVQMQFQCTERTHYCNAVPAHQSQARLLCCLGDCGTFVQRALHHVAGAKLRPELDGKCLIRAISVRGSLLDARTRPCTGGVQVLQLGPNCKCKRIVMVKGNPPFYSHHSLYSNTRASSGTQPRTKLGSKQQYS